MPNPNSNPRVSFHNDLNPNPNPYSNSYPKLTLTLALN